MLKERFIKLDSTLKRKNNDRKKDLNVINSSVTA